MQKSKRPSLFKIGSIIFFIMTVFLFIFTDCGIYAIENETSYDIIVSKDGTIKSIQDAIDIANYHDMILIKNGTYFENIVIDKSVTLIGENRTTTIIDGRKAGNVIKINSEQVNIFNLTIQHSGIYFPNSGINLSSTDATIKNNIIQNNFYGMTIHNGQNNVIEKNLIQKNQNCGIYMSNSSKNNIFENIITNHTYNGIGIYDSSDDNIIQENTLTKNGYCALNIRISHGNLITRNTISRNNIGIHIPSTQNNISQNILTNNTKDYDEELLTPGFVLTSLFISLMFIVVIKRLYD